MLITDAITEQKSMGLGFLFSTDPEDDDPVGDMRDPVARFTAAAVDVGLIRPGDKLDRNVVDLCLRGREHGRQDRRRVPSARLRRRHRRESYSG
jgi:hypothetical protein